MGIASGQTHPLGRQQKFFAKAESTRGTFIKPVATDAIKTITSDMVHEISREPIIDNSDYRHHTEQVTDKETNTWSWDGNLRPSGVAATQCNLGAMINALMGANNAGAASKWIYTIASIQEWPTLSLTRHFNEVFQECLWGAVVQNGKFSIAAGGQPMAHFDGVAMGYARTGRSTLDGAMAASPTMVVQTADKNSFSENSVVKIGSTADAQVIAVGTRPSFTVDASISEDSAVSVVPYVPTPTYVGSPIPGTLGSLLLDGDSSIKITSADVEVANNHDIFEDEVFSQKFSDFAPDKMEAKITLGLRLRQDEIVHLMNYLEFATKDLNVTFGTVEGSRFKFDLDYGEQMAPKMTFPQDKAGTAQLVFKGLGSGANGPLIITTD